MIAVAVPFGLNVASSDQLGYLAIDAPEATPHVLRDGCLLPPAVTFRP